MIDITDRLLGLDREAEEAMGTCWGGKGRAGEVGGEGVREGEGARREGWGGAEGWGGGRTKTEDGKNMVQRKTGPDRGEIDIGPKIEHES